MAKKYHYFIGLNRHKKNQLFNNFALGLVVTLGVCHLIELIFFDHASGGLILLRALQYAGMAFVISIPRMIFEIEERLMLVIDWLIHRGVRQHKQ